MMAHSGASASIPTCAVVLVAALLSGCSRTVTPEEAARNSPHIGPSMTFIAEANGCQVYRIKDGEQTMYVGSNTGNYGGCSVALVLADEPQSPANQEQSK